MPPPYLESYMSYLSVNKRAQRHCRTTTYAKRLIEEPEVVYMRLTGVNQTLCFRIRVTSRPCIKTRLV